MAKGKGKNSVKVGKWDDLRLLSYSRTRSLRPQEQKGQKTPKDGYGKDHKKYLIVYSKDMSTRKGKKKNNSVKGTWVIELFQAIELKENQKFRPGEPNKTKRGARRTRMRSRDLFGQEESRSFRPGCQESE
ncbi:hypothetical protein RRG08_044920 [Elysia crispata]|uniref:Uncharacterized protein n=1 Tax=Elysia crispata TaxID=231223 RepID=A0AAE1DLR5_9GAST|nr:hypothetical protein RRG08_044920 [Elysia crispata]